MTISILARTFPRLAPQRDVEKERVTALGAKHRRRVRRVILVNSGASAAIGLAWAIKVAFAGLWLVVGMDTLAVCACSGAAALALLGHLRLASRVLLVTIFLLVCFCAVFIDPPVASVNRSIHHFLIAMGTMSCLLLRAEPLWARCVAPLTFFLAWAAFASFDFGIVTSIALPADVRLHSSWFNCLAAVLMLFATLQVILTDTAERSSEEGELKEALLRGDFLLHYQPQINSEGHLIGAEALIRWNHPRRGMVPPGEFISLAETSGLILPMGTWVLKTACERLVVWSQHLETASLVLAVNVSVAQFVQPDFVATVLSELDRTGADASKLKLEITEGMLAKDLDDIVTKMTTLKNRGVGFSLDDFGTGFSSLSYLRRLPLDQMKIDQSFVRHMMGSQKDEALVQAVIKLGQSMDLCVIAEGVETAEQRQFLLANGCTNYQGYLFSEPIPAADFAEFAHKSFQRYRIRLVPSSPTALTSTDSMGAIVNLAK